MDQQAVRLTKSASKGGMMSPYNSRSAKTKDATRSYRMQNMTASKTHGTTNLLNSNAKQSAKNKFELPLLSNRSNSKPNLMGARNPSSALKES